MPVQSGGGVIFILKTLYGNNSKDYLTDWQNKELSTLNCKDFSDWPKVLQEENRIIKIPLTCTKFKIVSTG